MGRRRFNPERADSQQGTFIQKEAIALFAEKGYSAATMDDLCARTGLNKGTIYYYYKSKADILFNIADATVSGHLSVAESISNLDSPENALRELTEKHVAWLLENADAARIWSHEYEYMPNYLTSEQMEVLNEKRRKYYLFLRSVLALGMERGQFVPLDLDVLTRSILALLNASLRWPRSSFKPKQLLQTISALLLSGIVNRPPSSPQATAPVRRARLARTA